MPARNGWNAARAANWIARRRKDGLCLRGDHPVGPGLVCAACRQKQRAPKHCGWCGERGHNVLTCGARLKGAR
jgi:hypothetical protein